MKITNLIFLGLASTTDLKDIEVPEEETGANMDMLDKECTNKEECLHMALDCIADEEDDQKMTCQKIWEMFEEPCKETLECKDEKLECKQREGVEGEDDMICTLIEGAEVGEGEEPVEGEAEEEPKEAADAAGEEEPVEGAGEETPVEGADEEAGDEAADEEEPVQPDDEAAGDADVVEEEISDDEN